MPAYRHDNAAYMRMNTDPNRPRASRGGDMLVNQPSKNTSHVVWARRAYHAGPLICPSGFPCARPRPARDRRCAGAGGNSTTCFAFNERESCDPLSPAGRRTRCPPSPPRQSTARRHALRSRPSDNPRQHALARVLTAASERHGTVIYLLADEPYARLVFDDRTHISPAESYPHTLIAYSYGKTLVAPGERLGWLALGPDMPEADRAALREAVDMAQVSHGCAFAGRTLQRALPDLEGSASTSPPCSGGATAWWRGCGRPATTCRSRRAPSSSSHAPGAGRCRLRGAACRRGRLGHAGQRRGAAGPTADQPDRDRRHGRPGAAGLRAGYPGAAGLSCEHGGWVGRLRRPDLAHVQLAGIRLYRPTVNSGVMLSEFSLMCIIHGAVQ